MQSGPTQRDKAELVMAADHRKRARRSTAETLDGAMQLPHSAHTLRRLLEVHDRVCDHDKPCPVADAIKRRLRQVTTRNFSP